MMGNMKSTPLEFDDNGNMTFDIPDLNVDKFNVFLNGAGYEVELSSQDVTENDWPKVQYHAGNVNPYFYQNNPGESRWKLHVSGKGAEEAGGYLTYFANPIMNFELVPNDDSEELHKGGTMLIEARLIDENGNPKPVLKGAQLTAEINYRSENQDEMEAQLEFSEDEAKWKSEWFNLSDYSVYNITVHFTYKFISLDYTLDPVEITPLPVKAKTLEKETFISKRIDGKEHFEIDKVRLYTGYGNEDIVMEKFENKGSNTVSVVDKGQKFEVTAEQEGDVLFDILLKDKNNPDFDPVSVTVSGTV